MQKQSTKIYQAPNLFWRSHEREGVVVQAALAELRAMRLVALGPRDDTWPAAVAWKVAAASQNALYRVIEFADASMALWEQGHHLASLRAASDLLEACAQLCLFNRHLLVAMDIDGLRSAELVADELIEPSGVQNPIRRGAVSYSLSVERAVSYLDSLAPGSTRLHEKLATFGLASGSEQMSCFTRPPAIGKRVDLSSSVLGQPQYHHLVVAVLANLVMARHSVLGITAVVTHMGGIVAEQ